MIEGWQAACLALLQGLTEFLPISSSAHLLIPGKVFGWPDQGLAFDVAVHVGTLAAVLVYFRGELLALATGAWDGVRGRRCTDELRQLLALALATGPVVLTGLLAGDWVETRLRSLPVIAATTLLFGLLLIPAHRASRCGGSAEIGPARALLVGLAQALAVVPGVSRSGITMTAAMLLGVERSAAARFSFLLSIPVIGGAGLLKGMQLGAAAQPAPWLQLFAAAALAAATAYSCIAVFLRFVERVGLLPFVYYRILLAVFLILVGLA